MSRSNFGGYFDADTVSINGNTIPLDGINTDNDFNISIDQSIIKDSAGPTITISESYPYGSSSGVMIDGYDIKETVNDLLGRIARLESLLEKYERAEKIKENGIKLFEEDGESIWTTEEG